MPYKLVKKGKGYKVQTKSGPHKNRVHSKKTMSHTQAVKQLRALYANMPKGEK